MDKPEAHAHARTHNGQHRNSSWDDYLQVESVTNPASTPGVVQGETESSLLIPHRSADASGEDFRLAGFFRAAMPGMSQPK
jgi:hypothetical protein